MRTRTMTDRDDAIARARELAARRRAAADGGPPGPSTPVTGPTPAPTTTRSAAAATGRPARPGVTPARIMAASVATSMGIGIVGLLAAQTSSAASSPPEPRTIVVEIPAPQVVVQPAPVVINQTGPMEPAAAVVAEPVPVADPTPAAAPAAEAPAPREPVAETHGS